MKETLSRNIILALITCLIPLSKAFSQSEKSGEASSFLNQEVFPNYQYEYIPDFTYAQVEKRIQAMGNEMEFELNDKIFAFIQYFTVRNRDYTKMVLARKDLFFPLFDTSLQRHQMPLEIKYLAIIESGLDPQIKSRVGAMGLWQFMPATGRMYGMEVNSDVDDRMDPELSSDAAAKYLKSLYRMFGDWEVALAAYNCGPGNVRKAIRKSGGKNTFWEIYNFLPKETRSYIPQFQAMLYIMNHLEEHNFHLEEPTYPLTYENMRFNRAMSLEKLSELTDICISDLEKLNPSIKNRTVPESNRSMVIKIPKSKTLFVNENLAWISDSLNSSSTNILASNLPIEITPVKTLVSEIKQVTTYRVKSGDVLSTIAAKNGITVTQLKAMNNLQSNIIRVGQTLVIKSTTDSNKTLAENTNKTSSPRTYTVRPGDSLWIISKKIEGLTIEEIKRLNNLNGNNIKPGQKLIIG
jgi:membrane-bound lytic murein transglycosylase D